MDWRIVVGVLSVGWMVGVLWFVFRVIYARNRQTDTPGLETAEKAAHALAEVNHRRYGVPVPAPKDTPNETWGNTLVLDDAEREALLGDDPACGLGLTMEESAFPKAEAKENGPE